MKKITLVLALSCVVFVNAQSLWKKIDLKKTAFKSEKTFRKAQPKEFSLFSLDLENFKNQLTSQTKGLSKTIYLPTHEGNVAEYNIKESSNFTEPLNPKYGFIKTYSIQNTSNKNEVGKISIGTDGIHMILNSAEKGTLYVDPYTKDNNNYIAYNRNSVENINSDFECLVKSKISKQEQNTQKKRNPNDGNLRTYRFALACTGEYANYHINDQGVSSGTETERRAAVLSAMNTALSQINEIFEREMSVKLDIVLVGGENPVIFLDSNTDGYTGDDISTMIDENVSKCNSVIGLNNYDLGHLLHKDAASVNGLAYTPSVCSSFKGGGVTGAADPIGFDYVNVICHEIGHQFGANHTFNNTRNRNDATAVEPGSGSTIMSYAGINAPNVQDNHDDYFHAVSIDEMWNTIQSTFCGVTSPTGNTAPTADAGPDYTVPASTPLKLTGTGDDVDGTTSLTYNWDQLDNEIAGMPPERFNNGGPLFRSLSPGTSPTRYLPELSTVVAGSTFSTWEVIPAIEREINFAFNVRDNHSGGGSSARDDMKITVVTSNGFQLTSFNTSVSIDGATTQTITWDVANTDQAPISCQNVRIKLSTDGGLTFPIILEDSTPNDGTHDVTFPNSSVRNARIMVEAVDNIFYNVNAANFRINENPTASIENFEFSNFNLYPNPSNGNFKITFEVINTESVNIRLFDIRGRLVENRKFENTSSTFSEDLSFQSLNAGLYLLEVTNGNKKTVKKLVIK